MERFITTIFSEYGIVAGLLVLIILGMVFAFYKAGAYVPTVIKLHFSELGKMQDKFIDSLEAITEKNAQNSKEFLTSLNELGHEHKRQMEILEKISRIQDDIKSKLQ